MNEIQGIKTDAYFAAISFAVDRTNADASITDIATGPFAGIIEFIYGVPRCVIAADMAYEILRTQTRDYFHRCHEFDKLASITVVIPYEAEDEESED